MTQEIDIDSILDKVAIDTVQRLMEEHGYQKGIQEPAAAAETHRQEPKDFLPLLPEDFQPSSRSVIVGGGIRAKQSNGNKCLRAIVRDFLGEYSNAKNDRQSKSRIVSRIVDLVHTACPNGGGFIKQAPGGRWYKLDDSMAREKVGSVFRDMLSDQYRSSSRSKVAMRQRKRDCKRIHQAVNKATIDVSMPLPMDLSIHVTDGPIQSVQESDSAAPLPAFLFDLGGNLDMW